MKKLLTLALALICTAAIAAPTLHVRKDGAWVPVKDNTALKNYTTVDRLPKTEAAATYQTQAGFGAYTSAGGGRATNDGVAEGYATKAHALQHYTSSGDDRIPDATATSAGLLKPLWYKLLNAVGLIVYADVYDPIGDGSAHTLASAGYTLGTAQAKWPNAGITNVNTQYVDYAALKEASVAAGTTKKVVLGPKTYVLNETLDVNTKIEGQGRNKTIIKGDFAGEILWIKSFNCTLQDFTISPLGTPGTGQTGIAVGPKTYSGDPSLYIRYTDIVRVDVLDNKIGIALYEANFAKLHLCRIHSNSTGAIGLYIDHPDTDGGDHRITQCQFSGNNMDKLIYVVSGSGLSIENSKLFNGLTAAIEYNVTTKGPVGALTILQVTGCSFENYIGTSGAVIKIRSDAAGDGMGRIWITGNELGAWNAGVDGIDIDNAYDVVITGNEIMGAASTAATGIKITDTLSASITGNILFNLTDGINIGTGCTGTVGFNEFRTISGTNIINSSTSMVLMSNPANVTYANPAWLGSGTRTGTKFLRDDGSWQAGAGGAVSSGQTGAVQITDGAGGFTHSTLKVNASNGRVAFGNMSTTEAIYDVHGSSNGSTGFAIASFQDTAAGAARHVFQRAGGTKESFTAITDGMRLGVFQVKGATASGTNADNSKFTVGKITQDSVSQGAWSATSNPFRTSLYTIPTDSTIETEGLRITKDGYVGINLARSGNPSQFTSDPTEALEVGGNVKATAFIGDGSQLTGAGGMQYSAIVSYGDGQNPSVSDFGKVVIFTGGTAHTVPQIISTGSTYTTKPARTLLVNNTSSDMTIDSASAGDYFNINGARSNAAWTLGAYKGAVIAPLDSTTGVYQVESVVSGAATSVGAGDTSITATDTSDGYLSFTEDNTEQMRLSGGRLSIGTAAPGSTAAGTNAHPFLTVDEGTTNTRGPWFGRSSSTNPRGPWIVMSASQGSWASPSAMADTHILGGFRWYAYGGASPDYQMRAQLYAKINGTVSGDTIPTDLLMGSVGSTGAINLTLRNDSGMQLTGSTEGGTAPNFARPTCAAATRLTLWAHKQTSGTDQLQICVSTDGGTTFAWKDVTLGTDGG